MSDNKEKKGGLGFAATIIGAAAAGFYLYGPKGKENRVKLKAWTLKAKGEVLEQFEKCKEINDERYEEIVDKVTAKYGKLKTVGEEEAEKLNKELKRHWNAIKRVAKEDAVPKKKVAKKATKKTAQKAS
jgi:gas vesicle protein